ncbi:Oligopeptide transport ATP-binding protein OppD [Roseovarius albus]|uniref:Oligopeptide transport ATP-binding protein OppD n=1 Tax=Roseovarius albus TaxID=1247867 RepID=A0A1X7A3V7_9RHOB|nr:ABC transporter ATP-binding protein [Roseovarius albus]SLN69729.1 Oligopeptide transport ATP-binding protein OppD [Roseovarius albus]
MDLLNVSNLTVSVVRQAHSAAIVDSLSFDLQQGQCLGIVGESGSGKSTAAMAIMGLLDSKSLNVSGKVIFDGTDLARLSPKEFRQLQGTEIAMIFQDPMSSLNPVLRIGDQIIECVQAHRRRNKKEAREKAVDVLTQVGMPDPEGMLERYPHQLSGGQRQRVMIAMAIVFEPRLLIADEPTTALDLTIQAQILELLKTLSRDLNMALILITHDLGVVSQMCDEVIVLYSGRDVERGPAEEVLEHPSHPYTVGLLGAHPSLDADDSRLTPIPGAPPSIWHRPSGCAFRDRCKHAKPQCAERIPSLFSTEREHHKVACLLNGDVSMERAIA